MLQSTLQSFWIDNRIFKCVIESETAMIDRDNQQMRQSGTKFLKLLIQQFLLVLVQTTEILVLWQP